MLRLTRRNNVGPGPLWWIGRTLVRRPALSLGASGLWLAVFGPSGLGAALITLAICVAISFAFIYSERVVRLPRARARFKQRTIDLDEVAAGHDGDC